MKFNYFDCCKGRLNQAESCFVSFLPVFGNLGFEILAIAQSTSEGKTVHLMLSLPNVRFEIISSAIYSILKTLFMWVKQLPEREKKYKTFVPDVFVITTYTLKRHYKIQNHDFSEHEIFYAVMT